MSEQERLAMERSAQQRGLFNAVPKQMEDWQLEEIRIQEELRRKEYQREIEQKERAELRDRFAMAALPGFLGQFVEAHPSDFEEIAKDAYGLADAMLKARGDE